MIMFEIVDFAEAERDSHSSLGIEIQLGLLLDLLSLPQPP